MSGGVTTEIVGLEQLRELDERLHRSAKELTEGIATDVLLPSVRTIFASGGFARLAESTLEMRRRRGITGTTPLVATGKLAGSFKRRFTEKVAAAGATFPAGPLQKGFTSAGAIRGKTVPAREFIYLTDAAGEESMNRIDDFYTGEGSD